MSRCGRRRLRRRRLFAEAQARKRAESSDERLGQLGRLAARARVLSRRAGALAQDDALVLHRDEQQPLARVAAARKPAQHGEGLPVPLGGVRLEAACGLHLSPLRRCMTKAGRPARSSMQ